MSPDALNASESSTALSSGPARQRGRPKKLTAGSGPIPSDVGGASLDRPKTPRGGHLSSLKEAASRLGMSAARVQSCAERGEIPSVSRGGELFFDVDRVRVHIAANPLPEHRGRRVDPNAVRLNQALYRLARHEMNVGGVVHELAVITGMTLDEIRSRVDSARWDDPEEAKPTALDTNDRRYLGKLYTRSKDPAIRAWMAAMKKPSRN